MVSGHRVILEYCCNTHSSNLIVIPSRVPSRTPWIRNDFPSGVDGQTRRRHWRQSCGRLLQIAAIHLVLVGKKYTCIAKKSKLKNCVYSVQSSKCDLESMRIGPRADSSFEEGGKILEGGKFVVLQIGGKIVGISTKSPLLDIVFSV